MEKKLMLIVNPAAGRGGYKVNFAEALHTLDLGGYRTTLFFTSGRGEATEFAARHAGNFDTVACIGGDGTLSEVLAGLMQLDSPPPCRVYAHGHGERRRNDARPAEERHGRRGAQDSPRHGAPL